MAAGNQALRICSDDTEVHLDPVDRIARAEPDFDRLVCRASRERDVHDGYDRKVQCVKAADVWGIEKVWGALYEAARQQGDFASKKSD